MNYVQIIENNAAALPGSFLYDLHENDFFNKKYFDEFLNNIKAATKSHLENEFHLVDKKVTTQIVEICFSILAHFIYHLDTKDQSKISNFADINMTNIEELRIAALDI